MKEDPKVNKPTSYTHFGFPHVPTVTITASNTPSAPSLTIHLDGFLRILSSASASMSKSLRWAGEWARVIDVTRVCWVDDAEMLVSFERSRDAKQLDITEKEGSIRQRWNGQYQFRIRKFGWNKMWANAKVGGGVYIKGRNEGRQE